MALEEKKKITPSFPNLDEIAAKQLLNLVSFPVCLTTLGLSAHDSQYLHQTQPRAVGQLGDPETRFSSRHKFGIAWFEDLTPPDSAHSRKNRQLTYIDSPPRFTLFIFDPRNNMLYNHIFDEDVTDTTGVYSDLKDPQNKHNYDANRIGPPTKHIFNAIISSLYEAGNELRTLYAQATGKLNLNEINDPTGVVFGQQGQNQAQDSKRQKKNNDINPDTIIPPNPVSLLLLSLLYGAVNDETDRNLWVEASGLKRGLDQQGKESFYPQQRVLTLFHEKCYGSPIPSDSASSTKARAYPIFSNCGFHLEQEPATILLKPNNSQNHYIQDRNNFSDDSADEFDFDDYDSPQKPITKIAPKSTSRSISTSKPTNLNTVPTPITKLIISTPAQWSVTTQSTKPAVSKQLPKFRNAPPPPQSETLFYPTQPVIRLNATRTSLQQLYPSFFHSPTHSNSTTTVAIMVQQAIMSTINFSIHYDNTYVKVQIPLVSTPIVDQISALKDIKSHNEALGIQLHQTNTQLKAANAEIDDLRRKANEADDLRRQIQHLQGLYDALSASVAQNAAQNDNYNNNDNFDDQNQYGQGTLASQSHIDIAPLPTRKTKDTGNRYGGHLLAAQKNTINRANKEKKVKKKMGIIASSSEDDPF